MKIIAFIIDTHINPVESGCFDVSFSVSSGDYTSNGVYSVDILLSEDQVRLDLKDKIAISANDALGTSMTAADVRLF